MKTTIIGSGKTKIYEGDIVKLRQPMPDANPNQLYQALENSQGVTSIFVKALGTGLTFAPILDIQVSELEKVSDKKQGKGIQVAQPIGKWEEVSNEWQELIK